MSVTLEQAGTSMVTSRCAFILGFVSTIALWTIALLITFYVLGFVPSSRKYKHDIQPMEKASEKLYGLKPVRFKYHNDKKGTTQYGLIAEEAAEAAPDL